MVSEGVPIDLIEAAALGYGFPIGPATLSDEVGIDVLAKIAPVVAPLLGDRAPDEKAVLTMLDDGRLGRKSGGGFYRYEAGKKEEIDPTVYDLLGVTPSRPIDPARITERLVLSFVNEAARCLEEEVLRSARDGDVGAIMGVGWPPYTGGPFWYADQLGAAAIVDRLEALAVDHGPRFEPAPILREHAASGRSFRS